jgi:hypothetical protein
MTTIVRLRDLFTVAEKVNGGSLSSLCCDHAQSLDLLCIITGACGSVPRHA